MCSLDQQVEKEEEKREKGKRHCGGVRNSTWEEIKDVADIHGKTKLSIQMVKVKGKGSVFNELVRKHHSRPKM